jgi:hypothetical protein
LNKKQLFIEGEMNEKEKRLHENYESGSDIGHHW